jgi:hypothetical protein
MISNPETTGAMIGSIIGTLFLTFVVWIGYQSTLPEHTKPGPSLPLPLSMGKERFTGRTRDASTFTQTLRRKAVVSGAYGNPCHVLRETNHTSGFTNGVLELYSISGLCEAACKVVADVCDIYDGGNAGSEYPNILDGGTYTEDVFDGGDAFITNPNTLDGSGAFVMDGGSAYFTILNYILLNGGNAQTNVCSPSNNARQPCEV